MFEDAENFADVFRGGLPYYILIMLPILIIYSSNPVLGTEFSVQRMSQFDVGGFNYGCRSSALSLEAKSIYTWSTGRHCVVAKLQDLTIDQYYEIRQKAGGLVLMLPNDIAEMGLEEKEHLNLLEQAMLAQPSSIPIYFTPYDKNMENIISDISRSPSNIVQQNTTDKPARGSALAELFDSISANGYQITVAGASHAASKTSRIPIVQGELAPLNYAKQYEATLDKLPLIVIAAHLKTFGLYNEYPLNADVAALMTVADLFSKMQNNPLTTPKYRLMFLVSESGPLLNFQGIKRWLDENVQLQNVDFVLCLDTITQSLNPINDTLYMHVSKPPKEGSSMNNFYKILQSVGDQHTNLTIDGVHKKINLAEQQLAWEHERFSMKRMPAFTISSLKTPKDSVRVTVFKDNEELLLEITKRNVKVIAEALARYIYNINSNGDVFADAMNINKNLVKSYFNIKSALHNNDLKNGFEKYLRNVKIMYDKPDAREPDFMFYDGQEANLNVYRVKPAVFDLFLTIIICAYLTTIYFVIQYFPKFYDITCSLTKADVSTNAYSNQTERAKLK